MRKPPRIISLSLLAWSLLLPGCSSQIPDLETVQEPPRIEKPTLDPSARIRCVRYAPGAPDPSKGTVLESDLEAFMPILKKRLETCADRNDALNDAWDAIGGQP